MVRFRIDWRGGDTRSETEGRVLCQQEQEVAGFLPPVVAHIEQSLGHQRQSKLVGFLERAAVSSSDMSFHPESFIIRKDINRLIKSQQWSWGWQLALRLWLNRSLSKSRSLYVLCHCVPLSVLILYFDLHCFASSTVSFKVIIPFNIFSFFTSYNKNMSISCAFYVRDQQNVINNCRAEWNRYMG